MGISENLVTVRHRIAAACERTGREVDDVVLIAVSKTKPIESMVEAYAAGQRIFGENYVQEAAQKATELKERGIPAELHLIGPLQRNKAKLAVGLFSLIHSVDRIELALEVHKVAVLREVVQDVLIQVNVSGEVSKSGVAPESLLELVNGLGKLNGIRLQGLMCIGRFLPEGVQVDERRAEFALLRKLREQVSEHLGVRLPHLSMGMSDDFVLAVEEGATLVRVGSALFGAR